MAADHDDGCVCCRPYTPYVLGAVVVVQLAIVVGLVWVVGKGLGWLAGLQ
jgi:hypothetical protein